MLVKVQLSGSKEADCALCRGECCSSRLWIDCGGTVVRSVCVYVWVAFAVKEKGKWCAPPSCAPIGIWGDIAPKREKNRRKVNDFLFSYLKCYLYLLKFWIAMTFVCWPRRTREKRVYAREMSLTRAYRAHTNSDLIFLLSQVSHKEGKGEEKDGETQ